MVELPEAARDRFLQQFEGRRRGPITNDFLAPIRNRRADTPVGIIAAVRAEVLRKAASPYCDDERRQQFSAVLAALDTPEAIGFAEYCLAYEALPGSEREALKAVRAEQYRIEWMAQQAATPRQVDLLRSLGYAGPVANRADASERISALLSQRRGTGR